MADETPTPETPVTGETTPPVMGSETPTRQPTAEELSAELERTRQALKGANKESAERRKRLEELEAADKARQQAEMTALERAQAERAELEARLAKATADNRRHTILDAVAEQAERLSVVIQRGALADAYAAGDFAELELDETGAVKGLREHVQALIKRKPWLIAQQPAQAPDIDAQQRGDGQGLTEERKRELAQRYNIR